MIINITDRTVSTIINRTLEDQSIHLYSANVESQFFSERLNRKAGELGLLENSELEPQQNRIKKEMLACDPIYLAYELLEQYLNRNYVERFLHYDKEAQRLYTTDLPSSENFLEPLIEDINANIESYLADKDNGYDYLVFTPCFFIKVLLFADPAFRDITNQAGITERLALDTRFLESYQLGVEEIEDRPLEEVLTEKSFSQLISSAEKLADRFMALKPYSDELEEAYQLGLEAPFFRLIVSNATDKEFKAFLNNQIKKRKKAHLPANVTLAKPLIYTKAFPLFPDREPDLYTIAEDENFKYQAKIMLTDGDGNPKALKPSDHRYITACNELYKQHGQKEYSIHDLHNFMGYPGHPKKEDIARHSKKLLELSFTVCWLIVVITEKATGKSHELSPANKEELAFFENCTGYNLTPLVKQWAIQVDHVIPAGEFGFSGNFNDTESAVFVLYKRPIFYRVAEEMKQIFSMPYKVLNTGNRFKSELSEAIFNQINKELSWEECANWTRNYKSFFGEKGLGFTNLELKNAKKKQNILDSLEKVLCHEYECGNIQGFCIERRSGNFYFAPYPLELDGTENPKEKVRKIKLNKARELKNIKAQFKTKLKNAGCNFISQRVYPSLKFALKVEDKNGKEIKKPFKEYKCSKGMQGNMR